MKIKILNIATILPFPETKSKYKLKENDFLVVLSKYLVKKSVNVDFVKIANYSNRALAKLSEKWEAYYCIPYRYDINGTKINVIKRIVFPRDKFKTLSFILTVLLSKRRLCTIVKQNYTCSHAHFLLIDGYFSYYLYKKYKIPYVLTVRDETYIFNKFVLGAIARKVLENAAFVLTTNSVNKSKLEKFTSKDIRVITHGVENDNLYLNTNVNKKVHITTVCKLNAGKRVDVLLNALKSIENVDYILNIIGNGPEYDYLNSISKGIKCNFLGELKHKEVIEYLKKSDIFILPSEAESFGRVYIEALASSNAVVAVEDTGIYGLFENNKEVVYMKKNSVDSLRGILNSLLNDKGKIRELKLNGYRRVEKNYTWEKVSDTYLEIYESIDKSNK